MLAHAFRPHWMIGVGIWRMMMIVVMIMVVMTMPMMMVFIVMVMSVSQIQPACPSAEVITQLAIRHVRSRCRCSLAFDMVVVAFLDAADLVLETQNFRSILAQHTGRWRRCGHGRMRVGPIRGQDLAVPAIRCCHDLFPERTDRAIRQGGVAKLFIHPFHKRRDDLIVVVQISGLQELDIRMSSGDHIGEAIDPVD